MEWLSCTKLRRRPVVSSKRRRLKLSKKLPRASPKIRGSNSTTSGRSRDVVGISAPRSFGMRRASSAELDPEAGMALPHRPGGTCTFAGNIQHELLRHPDDAVDVQPAAMLAQIANGAVQ